MKARLSFVLLGVTMLCGSGSAQQAPASDTLHRLQNANARLGAVKCQRRGAQRDGEPQTEADTAVRACTAVRQAALPLTA